MDNPLITVIVPVYKVEKYLERCVDSIVNQTYKNLEIILVDDGSPDRCGEMCDELAETDSRIKVIHKENGGLSSARNAGLDVMTGEYVGFVDSDDLIDVNMYGELLTLALNYNAQIICGGIERFTENGHLNYFNEKCDDFFCADRNQALAELTMNCRITNSLCDKLFYNSIFSGLRMTEGIIYEDHDIMHKCVYNAQRVVYTGTPYYKYFVNSDSITSGKTSKKHFNFLPVGRQRLKFYEEYSKENSSFAKIQYIEWALDLIYRSAGDKECKELRLSLIREIRTMLKENSDLPYSKKMKLKVCCFSIHPFVLGIMLDLFYLIKKQ